MGRLRDLADYTVADPGRLEVCLGKDCYPPQDCKIGMK